MFPTQKTVLTEAETLCAGPSSETTPWMQPRLHTKLSLVVAKQGLRNIIGIDLSPSYRS
jgi:hypothetical protein